MPASTGRHLVLWLLGRLRRHRVAGASMEPTLSAGQTLLVERAHPQAGDLVVAQHPERPGLLLIKRAHRRTPQGWILLGDNPAQSTDSRTLGSFPPSLIRGRVVCTFP